MAPTTTTTTTTTTTIALRPPTAVNDSFPLGTDGGSIFDNDDLGNPMAVITSIAGNDIVDPTLGLGVAPGAYCDKNWRFGIQPDTGDLEVQVRGFSDCVVPYTITNSEGSSDATITFGALQVAPIARDDTFPLDVEAGSLLVNDDLGNPTAVITSLNGIPAMPGQGIGTYPCDSSWYVVLLVDTGAFEVRTRGFGVCVIPYTIANSAGSSTASITIVGNEPPG